MRLLLDTHALLWALGDPARLSKKARDLIADPAHDVFVSAASAWEISTKVRLGKLTGHDHVVGAWSSYLTRLGVQALPISDAHALLAGTLTWEHRDPFDRMLAAQALTEGLTLVTRDQAFDSLGSVRTRW